MKKLFKSLFFILLVAFIAIPSSALAVEWIGTNQATISWNEVTQGEAGGAIGANDVIKYRVHMKSLPNGADTVVGDTETLQYTLTFTQEGRYIVGVQTVRIPENETEELVSTIVWSDSTDAVAVPNPFGIVFYERPSTISGLAPAAPTQ